MSFFYSVIFGDRNIIFQQKKLCPIEDVDFLEPISKNILPEIFFVANFWDLKVDILSYSELIYARLENCFYNAQSVTQITYVLRIIQPNKIFRK